MNKSENMIMWKTFVLTFDKYDKYNNDNKYMQFKN